MFITDTQEGELVLLDNSSVLPLVFKNLDGEVVSIVQTNKPWTHDDLMALDLKDILGPDYSSVGFNAYVGDSFVGSTEI